MGLFVFTSPSVNAQDTGTVEIWNVTFKSGVLDTGTVENWNVLFTVENKTTGYDTGTVENWTIPLDVPEQDYGSVETWLLNFKAEEVTETGKVEAWEVTFNEKIKKDMTYTKLVEMVIVPLIFILAPAFVLMRFEIYGFLVGLIIGGVVSHIAGYLPAFGLPLIILVVITIFWKRG